MTRFITCFVISFLFAGIHAVHQLQQTNDEEFLRKQDFVFQILWKTDDLETYHQDIIEKANNFKIQDLKNLPVDQNAVDELISQWKYGLLPPGLSASAFNKKHLREIKSLVDVLYTAPDFETFAVLSVWSSKIFNSILWFFAFAVATLHRPDMVNVRLPNMHETLPQYFFNSDVTATLNNIKNNNTCSDEIDEQVFQVEYSKIVSRFGLDLESRLTYLTEDIGMSNLHFYSNLDSPFFMSKEKYDLPNYRRGDNYFFDMRQLLARYYLERFANDLPDIEDIDWNRNIITGYYPNMIDYNGRVFPQRQHNSAIPVFKYKFVQLLQDYESRLTAAADEKKLLMPFGQHADSDDVFNDLMNAVQGNADSVNLDYYGSSELTARRILSFSPEVAMKRENYIVSSLENLNAGIRDPMLYRLYKRLVGIGFRYKSHIPPYTEKELNFPGVTVQDINVDKIVTYFDKFDSLLGYQKCSSKKNVPILARQDRLNHEEFSIRMKVNSKVASKAIVRLFLGPKFNVDGKLLDIAEAQSGFFQLDQFVVDLVNGVNDIVRKDSEFAFQVSDDPRNDEWYNKLRSAVDEDKSFSYYEQPYGYPRRMMIPRGKKEGLPLRLFAIVSPLDESKVKTIKTSIAGKELSDGRDMAFPFDRPVDVIRFETPNMALKDVLIYHK